MERLRVTFSHLSGTGTSNEVSRLVTKEASARKFSDSPDDVVIVSARRTPIAKGGRGAFKVSLHFFYTIIQTTGYTTDWVVLIHDMYS